MKLGMLISDLEGYIVLYCRGSISQSEILLLIKYFALDDIKLSTYLGWLSRTRHDNVWLDYPAQDNW